MITIHTAHEPSFMASRPLASSALSFPGRVLTSAVLVLRILMVLASLCAKCHIPCTWVNYELLLCFKQRLQQKKSKKVKFDPRGERNLCLNCSIGLSKNHQDSMTSMKMHLNRKLKHCSEKDGHCPKMWCKEASPYLITPDIGLAMTCPFWIWCLRFHSAFWRPLETSGKQKATYFQLNWVFCGFRTNW